LAMTTGPAWSVARYIVAAPEGGPYAMEARTVMQMENGFIIHAEIDGRGGPGFAVVWTGAGGLIGVAPNEALGQTCLGG